MNSAFGRFLVIFLRLCGIYWPTDGSAGMLLLRRTHFKLLALGCLANIFSLLIRLVDDNSNFSTVIESAIYLCHNLNSFCVLLAIRHGRRSIIRMIQVFTGPVYRYPLQMNLPLSPIDEQTKLARKLKRTVLIAYGIFFSVCMPLPYFYLTAGTKQIIPYWFPLPDQPIWLFLLLYTLEAAFTIAGTLVIPGVMVFVLHFNDVISSQWKILIAAVRSIKNNDVDNICRNEKSQDPAKVVGDRAIDPTTQPRYLSKKNRLRNEKWLRHCIQHHSEILSLFRHYVSCFKWIFAISLLYSTAIFSCHCYNFVKTNEYNVTIIQWTVEVLLVFSYTFLYCYAGETFKQTHNTLAENLYDINWMENSLAFRKLALMLLTRTREDMSLKFSSTIVACYAMYASVLKTSYALANVMIKTT